MFWKTRWENSIDGSRHAVPHAGLLQGDARQRQDRPATAVWTGTWRDPRFSPPADGGRPENALTGTIFTVNGGRRHDSIAVPEADGKMRFWRNTQHRQRWRRGQTATLPIGTLGYEWDEDLDNGFRPAGLVRLSTTTVNGVSYLQDYGSTYATGTATHTLTLYRRQSGALVFGAGTVQWAWGLDGNHDRGNGTPADARMQQATVNLFADMGVQPATLQPGLVAAVCLDRRTAPTSTIVSPAAGATSRAGTPSRSAARPLMRRRRRRWRRGLGGRRRDLAPRQRPRATGPTPGRRPAPAGDAQEPRRRRQRQPRDSRPRHPR